MGSFRAEVALLGKTYDVLYATYEFTREVDKKGLVASGVYGGEITMRVQSTDDAAIIEGMVNSQFKPLDGEHYQLRFICWFNGRQEPNQPEQFISNPIAVSQFGCI